jgi:hypothetical protein
LGVFIRRAPKQAAVKTLDFARPQPPPPVQAVESEDIPAEFEANFAETNERKKD